MRSAAELRDAYSARRTTPSEVAERALAAARASRPLALFIALDEQDVRAQAAASTRRWLRGAPLSPLDGVPVAIKDQFDVAGYATTCGTSFLRARALTDSLAVQRLRAAGALLFGKANMHELGMAPTGVNPHHGTARNPYDPSCDTGGSSSGAAAAVAAGLVPLALGTDLGGSLRIPAALCGVAALKPTFGRVPTAGMRAIAWSLEHAGPIGATVDDLRHALAALTGEPLELPALPPGLRVGICEAWWRSADADTCAAVGAAVDRLVSEGAVRRAVALPHVDRSLPVGTITSGVEAAASLEELLPARAKLSASVRVALELGRAATAVSFVQAQRARALIVAELTAALAEVDVLVTPTTATTARPYREDAFSDGELDEAAFAGRVAFTFPLNLAGVPAAQVPCGYDGNGLPIGLQVIAAHGADLRALAVAQAIERSVERRLPALSYDLLQGIAAPWNAACSLATP